MPAVWEGPPHHELVAAATELGVANGRSIYPRSFRSEKLPSLGPPMKGSVCDSKYFPSSATTASCPRAVSVSQIVTSAISLKVVIAIAVGTLFFGKTKPG